MMGFREELTLQPSAFLLLRSPHSWTCPHTLTGCGRFRPAVPSRGSDCNRPSCLSANWSRRAEEEEQQGWGDREEELEDLGERGGGGAKRGRSWKERRREKTEEEVKKTLFISSETLFIYDKCLDHHCTVGAPKSLKLI